MSQQPISATTASPGQVTDWAGRLMKLVCELERQCLMGQRDGAARFETCVAMAEAYVALDRVCVREDVMDVHLVRGNSSEAEWRQALEDFARQHDPRQLPSVR